MRGRIADAAKHDEAVASAELDDQAQVDFDQRRHAPLQLHHQAEQVAAALRREYAVERRYDRRCIAHRIVREQDRFERVVLEPGAKRIFVHRAMDRDQAADAGQPPAHRQLHQRSIRRRRLRRDQDDQRVALAAVGHARGQQADRLERDDA
jgi:hypothetical protein